MKHSLHTKIPIIGVVLFVVWVFEITAMVAIVVCVLRLLGVI